MESWLHKQVAKDLDGKKGTLITLEIGAGTLNQLHFEPEVGPYDTIEPFKELYDGSKLLKKIRYVYGDIDDIPHDHRYDRITSIATFEHICNLPVVVAKCGLLLRSGGALRVAIPSEGTMLWKLGWKLTTGLEFKRKYGLNYGILMAHEHVNTAEEIEAIVKYFFDDVSENVFGISKSLSLYQFYACRKPDLDKCPSMLCLWNGHFHRYPLVLSEPWMGTMFKFMNANDGWAKLFIRDIGIE